MLRSRFLFIVLFGLTAALSTQAQPHAHRSSAGGAQTAPLSSVKGTITIHVGKSGLFSGFGHNHTVVAPIDHGNVDTKDMAVEITVVTAQMKVTDSDVSEKDRAEVQSTMLGPKVLDAAKFPEIRFKSSQVEQTGPGHFRVMGKLDLHGASKELVFEVTGDANRYKGKTKLKQTDFGIQPVTAAGGAVKVKDELEIEFDVYPADFHNGKP